MIFQPGGRIVTVACPVWVDKEKVSASSAWPAAAAAVFLGGRVSDVCGGW